MTRDDFHRLFKATGPVVLPVIHVLDAGQTNRNIRVLIAEGAAGCFLINHDFGVPEFLPILREVRAAWPGLWMGVNFLAVTGRDAFPVLGDLARESCMLDAYWADDARIDDVWFVDGMSGTGSNDILIDGGNSFYKDDIRRAAQLEPKGVHYMDAGVSGGIWGLKIGYCTMIGGNRETYDTVEPILETLAPEDGYLYCGKAGSGHFVAPAGPGPRSLSAGRHGSCSP